MSLSEAMLDLAAEMDKLDPAVHLATSVWQAGEWAKQIRRLCKAAGNQPGVPFSPFDPRSDPISIAGVAPSDVAATQKALQRLQAKQQHMGDMAELEELTADDMRLCADGPEEGTSVVLGPNQQYAYVGGHFYVLGADGKLQHTPK